MKHLKTFETVNDQYDTYLEKGERVILMRDSADSKKMFYKIGDICRILEVDKKDFTLPYRVCNLTDENKYHVWVEYDQIIKAEPWNIDQNKFNL